MQQGDRRSLATAVRLSAFYGAVFAVVGVQTPFWPVWLAARGLSAGEIGLVIAASFWPRVVTSLVIPHHADRLGERRRPMVLLAAITLVGVALFGLADRFWMFMGLSLVTGATFAAILPLGEALALQEAHEHRFSYGRVRLWGSITFIVAAIAVGGALQQSGPKVVLLLLVVALAMTVAACLALPERPRPSRAGPPLGLGRLLRQPGLVSFVLAAGLIQASHVVYYGFATLHWRAAGHGEALIGWLWAEGVIAEIVLFTWAGAVLRRLPPLRLLTLAGGLSVLRWAVTALSTDLAVLIPAQALHAARRHCRAKGWRRSRCQRARWWSCTASCRMAARPIARRTRATPTRCTSSTAGAPTGRTTGCSVRRTCRCAVSDRAAGDGSLQRALQSPG